MTFTPPVEPPKKKHHIRKGILLVGGLVILAGVFAVAAEAGLRSGSDNGPSGGTSSIYSAAGTTTTPGATTTVPPAATTTGTVSAATQAEVSLLKCEGPLTSWTVWMVASPSSEMEWETMADATVGGDASEWVIGMAETVSEDLASGATYSQISASVGPQINQYCQALVEDGGGTALPWPTSAFSYGMAPVMVNVNGQFEPNPDAPNCDLLYIDLTGAW